MAPMSIRRTYTEDELNNALQDIMSGKLGTRRAAVQYNIPRSTLRNKVYKISSGAKRWIPSSMQQGTSFEGLADMNCEKNYLSPDEEDSNGENNQKRQLMPGTSDDLASCFADVTVRKSNLDRKSLTPQHHQCESNEQKAKPVLGSRPKPKSLTPEPSPQSLSPIGNTTWQNIFLHSLLFSGGLPLQQNFEEAIQLFNALLLKQDFGLLNPQLLAQLQQAQQPTQQEYHTGLELENFQENAAPVAVHAKFSQNPLPNSATPETESSVDFGEIFGEDPSVILKIPSYKPLAVSFTSTFSETMTSPLCKNKNIEKSLPSSPKKSTPSTLMGPIPQLEMYHNNNRHKQQHMSVNSFPVSPPLMKCGESVKSQSAPKFSLRDVIADSISRNFNQQPKLEARSASPSCSASSIIDYKRPSLSVIKNIGGTDTSCFATAPNLLGCRLNSNNHHQPHSQNMGNNNAAGGKGTRPKRGKYRNYDRDSLVEAVKAVQRGEMSVHRAGSYYGVPHSTLEYKVKERHLMRPRKREQKTQPLLDDRKGESVSSGNISISTVNTLKNSRVEGISVINNFETLNTSSSPVITSTTQPLFTAKECNQLPNDMKAPPALFEKSLAAQLQYPPQVFWHRGFTNLQMELGERSQEAAIAPVASPRVGATISSFAYNSDLMKSQMWPRFQDNVKESPNLNANKAKSIMKINNVPDTTDNIFEPICGANGSFLDGIIRKSLHRKISESKQGLFLTQSANTDSTTSMRHMNNKSVLTDFKALKRPGSPLQYQQAIDIKRERASPRSDFSSSDFERINQQLLSVSDAQLPPSISEVTKTMLNDEIISEDIEEKRTREELLFLSKCEEAPTTSRQQSKQDHVKSENEESL